MSLIDLSFDDSHAINKEPALLQILNNTIREQKIAMYLSEFLNLYRITQRTLKLDGDIAEVGVYAGGSAKILAQASQNQKTIHLFDTFQGIPETTPGRDTVELKRFACPIEQVQHHLREFPQICFYPGMFPQSAFDHPELLSKKFAMVNLDVDTYVSTKAALEFFYPRMTIGGVMVIHDYHSLSCPGVRDAVDEFTAGKPDTLFDLWATQVAICRTNGASSERTGGLSGG